MKWIGEHLKNGLLAGVLTKTCLTSAACFYRPQVFEHLAGTFHLTPREADVLILVCQGLGPKEIATVLHISPKTVETFIRFISDKMRVQGRTEIILKAILTSGALLGEWHDGDDYGAQEIPFGSFGEKLYETRPVKDRI